MNGWYLSLIRVLLFDRTAVRFALGVIVGMGFSMSVILSTIGIMDGFDKSLKYGLKKSTGDIYFFKQGGFFNYEEVAHPLMEKMNITENTRMLQTEGFLLHQENSKGVLVKGIEVDSFQKVTGLNISFDKGDIALGKELAAFLKVKVGEKIVMAYASGNTDVDGLPSLHEFTVSAIVNHGIYQKDLRLVYVPLEKLQESLQIEKLINIVSLNVPTDFISMSPEPMERIREFTVEMGEKLGMEFPIHPFWYDYSNLLDAVKHEKGYIGLVLQLIVLVSIFNILAFVIFLNEKRSRELFLFKALGMSKSRMGRSWIGLVFLLWICACAFAWIFVQFFDWSLGYLSIFKLPGDVYHLGRLKLYLTLSDYAMVSSLALLWLIVVSLVVIVANNRRSILYGLRKEFA